MSRGPGRIERVIEATLRETDRSFSVEELAVLAYPGINRAEKKHRVAVLRTLNGLDDRGVLVWCWRTYEAASRHFICNGANVRSYVHGWLRHHWWSAERTLEQVDKILSDSEFQNTMEPGGLMWFDVEIAKAEREQHRQMKTLLPTELADLRSYRLEMAAFSEPYSGYHHQVLRPDYSPSESSYYRCALLGRFEPPGSPVFEYSMKNKPDRAGAPGASLSQLRS